MSEFHFVAIPGVSGTTAGTPIADWNAGGTVSDVVSMAKYKTAYFQVFWGVGTTGTTTITVIPTDDALKSVTTTAIPFHYKRISATETNTAWIASSSFVTTAGSDQLYVIRVRAADLPLVSGVKYEYVYLNFADTNSAALLGGCLIMMADPRYDEDTLDKVTA